MEEETYMEGVEPLQTCPVCESGISEGRPVTVCDWCDLQFHQECEPKLERCPDCRRYLPSAKEKALSADRRSTAILIAFPFVVIEAIIAIYSWLSHPSAISVPDIENWFSLGMIVNIILLVIALVSMAVVAGRGEGARKSKPRESQSEDQS